MGIKFEKKFLEPLWRFWATFWLFWKTFIHKINTALGTTFYSKWPMAQNDNFKTACTKKNPFTAMSVLHRMISKFGYELHWEFCTFMWDARKFIFGLSLVLRLKLEHCKMLLLHGNSYMGMVCSWGWYGWLSPSIKNHPFKEL